MTIRRRITVALILIAGMALLLFAAGWHFSSSLLRPPYKCHEAYVYCKGPSETGLPYRDVIVETSDGMRLAGWFIPREGSRKAVVFVHGHGGNRHAGLRYAVALNRAGFNYLLVELRGNMGDPERSFYSMGSLERKDIAAMIEYADITLGMKSIGILGFSMGASAAIPAMADDTRVRAGVLNSGFADVRDQLAHRARTRFHIPAFPLVDIIMLVAELRGGFDFDSAGPLAHIGRIAPRPLLIIHSENDPEVDFTHALRLYEAAGEPKTLWRVKGSGHTMEWNNVRAEAERRITGFFSRYL